jgi:hypothetical protein
LKPCPFDQCGCGGMVDAPDLGSGAARRGGSSPFTRTNRTHYRYINNAFVKIT